VIAPKRGQEGYREEPDNARRYRPPRKARVDQWAADFALSMRTADTDFLVARYGELQERLTQEWDLPWKLDHRALAEYDAVCYQLRKRRRHDVMQGVHYQRRSTAEEGDHHDVVQAAAGVGLRTKKHDRGRRAAS
jgi:uncharacterized protein RhaS with RHS repeats